MTQVKTVIKIPKEFKPAERLVIADEIIDFIRDRTASGLDKNNNKFKKYSKQYAKKKGVDIDDVDLILEGDMLDKLKPLKTSSGEIVIGYEKGDEVNGKAEGNILGSYGKEPNKKKARDFLGISREDLADILASI
jgi:hypothetical protein